MNRQLPGILASVAELTGRVSEVSKRLRQDTLLLFELQQELSGRLEQACQAVGEAKLHGPAPSLDGPRMLRLPEVVKKVGLSRSSIYQMVRAQQFPQPRQLGTHAVRWVNIEIEEWLRARELATGQGARRPRPTTSRR